MNDLEKSRKYDCWNYHRGNSPKTIVQHHHGNSHTIDFRMQ